MKKALFLAAAFLLASCSPTLVDIRPFVAHPDQKLEGETVLVSQQNRIRTAIQYMHDTELNEEFRLPGREFKTGNPFLTKPPLAKAKFTVFRLNIRNESDNMAMVEFDKIRLLDDLGNEYRPITKTELLNYWMGLVVIKLNKPITWNDQMTTVNKQTQKEKALYQAVYTGGLLPPKGEHTGFVAFREIPKKARLLQLLVEIVTRTSRYGNPLNVSLAEFNFSRMKVPMTPTIIEPDDVEGWRNEESPEAPK
jgi:hypothetical protein